MSTLIKEDDEFLYLYRYVHDEPDEFSEWEGDGYSYGNKYDEAVHVAEHFALFEVRIDYRIRKSDGEIFIDKAGR